MLDIRRNIGEVRQICHAGGRELVRLWRISRLRTESPPPEISNCSINRKIAVKRLKIKMSRALYFHSLSIVVKTNEREMEK